MAYQVLDESYSDQGHKKPYQWQLEVRGQWLKLDNDHVIECHYCQAGAKGIRINSSAGNIFINFDTLRTDNPSLRVQRLSFPSPDRPEVFLWFYKGDSHWMEFGTPSSGSSSSSIGSQDLERYFIANPAGSIQFSVGTFSYRLEFSTMTQINLATNMTRKVRRRPRYTADSTGLLPALAPPPAPPPLPSWLVVTWEFMGDEGVWTEYQSHICSYGSADIERAYQSDPTGQLKFSTRHHSYTLDFSGMFQINDAVKTRRAVRRTPHGASPAPAPAAAAPRWLFEDVDQQWKEFVKGGAAGCSVSSREVELRYQQNPAGSLDFSTRKFRYQLDFAGMTQKNLSTGTCRPVKRILQ
ncbi:unnamed protein product [Ophioblennius macclurei]